MRYLGRYALFTAAALIGAQAPADVSQNRPSPQSLSVAQPGAQAGDAPVHALAPRQSDAFEHEEPSGTPHI